MFRRVLVSRLKLQTSELHMESYSRRWSSLIAFAGISLVAFGFAYRLEAEHVTVRPDREAQTSGAIAIART